MSHVQHLETRGDIKANATYVRIGDLAHHSAGAQATEVELVKKVSANPVRRLFQPSKKVFVRKRYKFGANGQTSATGSRYLWSEYEILSKLRHPNIIQYVDFEYLPQKSNWTASIYMEYCREGDLSQYTLKSGSATKGLSEKQLWEIFHQLASALLYCHTGLRLDDKNITIDADWERPILHRDIKPANVVISSTENDHIYVKICDFGLAKYQCSTSLGSLVGTRGYTAPEITDEAGDWSAKADIYSLGITMRSLVCSTISETLKEIIEQCISSDPRKRQNSLALFEITLWYALSDDFDGTLLHNAADNGQLAVVNRLIEAGADVNAKSKKDDLTPLHAAAHGGHLTVLNRLIEVGANLQAKSINGVTPLHAAATGGSLAVVNRLIELGADPNHPNWIGSTPFHYAVHSGWSELLLPFLRAFGDPWLLDGFGRSVLDWASLYPPAFQAIGHLSEPYNYTNRVVRLQRLKRTIRTLLRSPSDGSCRWTWLGRCLLQIGDVEATVAFEQDIKLNGDEKTLTHLVQCDMCGEQHIQGPRYVCTLCSDRDLCGPCFTKYQGGEGLRNCNGHGFLKVPSQAWGNLKAPQINGAGESLDEWLERLKRRYAPINDYGERLQD